MDFNAKGEFMSNLWTSKRKNNNLDFKFSKETVDLLGSKLTANCSCKQISFGGIAKSVKDLYTAKDKKKWVNNENCINPMHQN